MRRAFTLIELLVVITIIGMLAAMSLGALYTAKESARVAKTQSTITKLDRIIQARYEEFASRRLPIANRRIPPKAMAELKLQVLREIIRMEMPDRLTDITYPRDHAVADPPKSLNDITETFAVSVSWIDQVGREHGAKETIQRPALNRRYFQKIYDHSPSAEDGTLRISGEFSPAELLYLIVTSDSEAREQFQENEIGDNDEDGFFEFVDGWGRPIMFLRWAPAYRSGMQAQDAENDHDPLDPRRVDQGACRLVPLIYSGGPDKKFGLRTDAATGSGAGWVFQFGVNDTAVGRLYTHGNAADIGKALTDGEEADSHHDNITNHGGF